jgi:hypothetical protein
MSYEVEPCVVWALRASLPFLAQLIEDQKNNNRAGPTLLEKAAWQGSVREGSLTKLIED